jgi:2-C-methyl-D-erythritol 2,4-cyclodiphosphate synthase
MSDEIRIGIGYDAHPLIKGRKLVLGGVEIPFFKGLEGWSDADVLTHAVMDALLGAAALGDIGQHFPTGEAEYEGISSLVLLDKVVEKLEERGYRVGNIDATVVAEKPGQQPRNAATEVVLRRDRLGLRRVSAGYATFSLAPEFVARKPTL